MAPSTNYPGAEETAWLHGSHTLALAAPLFEQTVAIRGFRSVVLYGFDRVRFPEGVRIGSRVRGVYRVLDVSEAAGGVQCRVAVTIEAHRTPKPVCVAEMILRLLD